MMFMIKGIVRGMVVKPVTTLRFHNFSSSRAGQQLSRSALAFSWAFEIFLGVLRTVIGALSKVFTKVLTLPSRT